MHELTSLMQKWAQQLEKKELPVHLQRWWHFSKDCYKSCISQMLETLEIKEQKRKCVNLHVFMIQSE